LIEIVVTRWVWFHLNPHPFSKYEKGCGTQKACKVGLRGEIMRSE
jgi:hypothetical protein